MSDLKTTNSLDIFGMCKQLQQLGWDAFVSDMVGQVAARRNHLPAHGVSNLTLDRSGRWRFTFTCALDRMDGHELSRGGRLFRMAKEKNHVLTVAGELNNQTELSELLDELNLLVQEETNTLRPAAAGDIPWSQSNLMPELQSG